MERFDLIVIGTGSGLEVSAAAAEQVKHNATLEAAQVANNILNPDGQAPVDYHGHAGGRVQLAADWKRRAHRAAAEERGIAYVSATHAYDATAYGASIEDHDGFVKALADPESGEILGCHVIGADASTLVQEAVKLMRFRLPLDVIARSIYIHPALPEGMQAAFARAAQQVRPTRDDAHQQREHHEDAGEPHVP